MGVAGGVGDGGDAGDWRCFGGDAFGDGGGVAGAGAGRGGGVGVDFFWGEAAARGDGVAWKWMGAAVVLVVVAYLGSVWATSSVDLNWSDDLQI